MPSISDEQYAYLGGLGYTGSMADRLQKYLQDSCIGYGLASTGSISDMMVRLGWAGQIAPSVNQMKMTNILKNADSSLISIGLLGASIVEGWPCTFEKTISYQLAARLRAKAGVSPVGGRGFLGPPSARTYTDGAWPYVTNATAAQFDTSVYALGPKHRILATNTPCFVRFPVDKPVTSWELHHHKTVIGGADAGYIKIDGGAAVDVNCNAGALAYEKLTFGPAAVSMEFGQDGTGYVSMAGIREYCGDELAGVQVHNLGNFGFMVDSWMQEVYHPDSIEALVNLNLNLLILQDFPGNDARILGGGAFDAATYKTKLNNFIVAIRAAGINCPIVVALPYDVSLPFALASSWADYRKVTREVVDANANLMYFDHSEYMPGPLFPGSAGLYGPDNLHTNSNGAALTYMVNNYMDYLF